MPGVYQQFPFWFTQSSFCEGNSPLITRHRIQVLSFQTLAHSFALFCTHQKRNSFIFKRFRTLCAKTTGGGVPPSGQRAKEYRGRWNRTCGGRHGLDAVEGSALILTHRSEILNLRCLSRSQFPTRTAAKALRVFATSVPDSPIRQRKQLLREPVLSRPSPSSVP